MRTLYQTLEQLALELPYGDDISQTTRAVSLIFHDEILYLPWRDRHATHAKLSAPHTTRHLIALVLREMQRHARAILLEHVRSLAAGRARQRLKLAAIGYVSARYGVDADVEPANAHGVDADVELANAGVLCLCQAAVAFVDALSGGIFEEGGDRPTSPLPAEHAAIVQRVWDGLGQASVARLRVADRQARRSLQGGGLTMMQLDDTIDDAADTLRFRRPDFAFEAPTDPDATSIYDLTPTPVRYMGRSPRRRRQIRDTRENVLRLREALAAGWDIAPELAHEERRLAALEMA